MESQEEPSTPQEISAGISRHIPAIVAAVVVLGVAGGVFWWIGLGSHLVQRTEYANRTETFSGSSASLKQTVIVPTLDSPCPPNKNIIWCSSFQLAWNEVRDKVIGAPLQVVGAEETADRLNQAGQSTSDLEARSFYAAGGRIGEGIINKIKKDMAVKFPSHPLPDLDKYEGGPTDRGILAYSYLTANVPFKYSFRQVEEGFSFMDSARIGTQVAGFGLWDAHRPQYTGIREQVEILYAEEKDRDHPWELGEYALDLCIHSWPYQVVVAMVAPKGSLAQTLEYVRLRTNEFQNSRNYKWAKSLQETDVVRIPEMCWKIDHRFLELIDKVVSNANPAMPIVEAMQTIEFRLDRSGAMLKSEAVLAIKAIPREFLFDRPFLVYMQKREVEQPFFVMWVDNAELLTRK